MSVARDAKPDAPAHEAAVQQPLEVTHALDRSLAEIEDQVAWRKSSGRSGTWLHDLDDL